MVGKDDFLVDVARTVCNAKEVKRVMEMCIRDRPITIPKESREPKPWLMPSGISARADSQKNLRRVKIRILKNLMIRQ